MSQSESDKDLHDLYQYAYEAIERAFVSLVMHTESGPYIHSGFCVSIGDLWYWITCDHVAQSVSTWAAKPSSRFSLAPLARGDVGIPLPPSQIRFVDVVGAIRSSFGASDGPGEEFLSDYDLSLIPICPTTICFLQNAGVVPFAGPSLFEKPDILGDKAVNAAFFVGGVPSSCTVPVGERRLRSEIKFLSVVPLDWCDPVLWLEPGWDHENFSGSLDGMSGGPGIIAHKGKVSVFGVQSKERTIGSRVVALGVVETTRLFEALRMREDEA